MQLGDARSGKLADNLTGFGRALRRAGVPVDSARIALAQQALLLVGVAASDDVGAALEAVLVSREQDRWCSASCLTPTSATRPSPTSCWRRCCPAPRARPSPAKRRPRVREALHPAEAFGPQCPPPRPDKEDRL
jgi:hypothetical protein